MSVRIAIINESSVVSDPDLTRMTKALQLQIQRDWYPLWGASASLVHILKGHRPPANAWWLVLLDDADQAGALGYHDITPQGQPLGKVFARTTMQYQGLVSVTLSHELLEMLGDPAINLLCQDGTDDEKFWAYEVCDAVEADEIGYDIPVDGQLVRVSNFVLPAYFETFRTTGPFDFKNRLLGPVPTLTPGGYMAYVKHGRWNQVFAHDLTEVTENARARFWKSRPHEGSRRLRRILGSSLWVPSTHPSVTEAP